ncbi:redoxin domain-containing protein [Allorhodopirellula solitaria]|uniref:Thiol-disulfide oxidoreductase ResA n=1 Tax=Allorhodopirellula solitaria TaxID=2527987 RepID=A0A5C5YDF0_9BACT|nr:redoxin domain-containing protein [Allorhodopirellula solitaria]TWT72988.1 Thiol-disulfide oxidoreductase ResA [Allorhodopirellula solitaria]
MNPVLRCVSGLVLLILVTCLCGLPVSYGEESASPAAPPYLLQMIRDDAVHEELGLDETAIQGVDEALAEVDPRWWVSRILPAEEQAAEVSQLTEILRGRLAEVLDEGQRERLIELERQAAGTRVLEQDDTTRQLAITPTQAQQLSDRFDTTDAEVARIQQEIADQKIDTDQASQQTTAIQQEERQALLSILSDDQRRKIGSLIGEPFDFSSVKRTYPRAPELITEDATWLDGDGVQLTDLRGKVVVVFFYAFQCINCQRNFPHYLAWQRDMADDGLVVIGIQTPETSAERDRNKVAAAKDADGFEFPVLFDQAAMNWQAWGTTMWPSTYVIDKDGFIRRWWQGEMNWKGTPGEQQMRTTIEELLAEPR